MNGTGPASAYSGCLLGLSSDEHTLGAALEYDPPHGKKAAEAKLLFYWDYLTLMSLCIFIAHYGSRRLIRKKETKL